jgi:beta-lactamase regulating signal transducer with metallopeptidase domain
VFTSLLIPLEHWLTDVYLLSTVLLLAALAVARRFTQPSRRMAATRSAAAGLVALAILATAPGWPRMAAIEWSSSELTPVTSEEARTTLIEPALGVSIAESSTSIAMIQPADTVTVALPAHAGVPESAMLLAPPALRSWRRAVVVAFGVGAVFNLVWLVLGAIQAARLRRSAIAATPRLELVTARISLDQRNGPRVGLSTHIDLPVAIGVLQPMIVLPVRFAESECDDRLEAALAHEWAHIRNGDLHWLAVLRLLNVILFAQPLYWWLRREIRADQEALADAAASSLHGDGRVTYAETLVGWARSSHRQQSGALASAALALWERPSMLNRRVRLLLDPDNRVEPATSRRWKLAAACTGLLASLLLSIVTLRPSAATAQVMKAPQGANNPSGAASQKTSVGGDRFEYAGRVVNPEGKPVIGAKMHLSYVSYHGQAPPAIRATSDAEGRFRIETRKVDFVDTTYDTPWTTTQVVATAAGFGLGWADASKDEHSNTDPRNLTIRLAREDTPITGRLVDLEGRPVAGATIRPLEVREPENGDLAPWIAASTSGSGGAFEIEREYLKRKLWPRGSGLPVTLTTDVDGRFAIQGVGGERLIRLKLSGPTIQTKEIGVLTRSTVPFRVTNGRGSADWGIALYYGTTFTHAVAPTKPVIGVVKDTETGKPLAGVRIASDRTAEFPVYGFNGIEATTDEYGRYRLIGLPKGTGNQFIAIPAKGQPFLAARVEVPDSPGLDPVSLDIGLKRGIVIEGRVTDKTTGEPLKAYVAYNAYEDNPHLSEAPGFKDARVWGQYQTEPDGSFRVVGLPGRGLIAAMCIGGAKQYLTGMGLPKVLSRIDSLPVVPDRSLGHFNTLSEVDPPMGATTFHHDLALISGVTRTVRVVDSQGRPLTGARIKFQPRVTNLSEPQKSTEFQVEALGPDEIRPLVAFHDQLKLAGSVDVRANDKGITELKLVPWGTLIGRLVDEDGGARAKVDILYSERHDYPAVTDTQGRFRVEALVPGQPAKVWVSPMGGFLSGTIASALALKAGEIKDLGDVREAK